MKKNGFIGEFEIVMMTTETGRQPRLYVRVDDNILRPATRVERLTFWAAFEAHAEKTEKADCAYEADKRVRMTAEAKQAAHKAAKIAKAAEKKAAGLAIQANTELYAAVKAMEKTEGKAEKDAARKAEEEAKQAKAKADTSLKVINRLVLAAAKMEQITIFSSAATRHLAEMGADVSTAVLKIKGEVKNELEADHCYMQMNAYCARGFECDGTKFVPLLVAASDARKATSTWIAAKLAEDYWKWSMCGLTLTDINLKIALNKYMAYQGLMWSASKPFVDVFGSEIDPSRIAIVKDGYVEVTGLMDVVRADGSIEHGVSRKVRINAFDGQGAIRSTLTNGESVTLRAPWIKAFVQATEWDEVEKFFVEKTGSTKFQTKFGERDLKDVDLVLTESCFKAVKLYKSWEQYEKAFRELGHEVCVCVREHQPKLKGMPYQQGQTLQGNDVDVEKFALHSLKTVSKYGDRETAPELLNGWQKASAKVYPALMKECHTARTMQEKYASRKLSMQAGKIPELGYNAFGAADPVAFWEHVAGLEIVGSLKAGECVLLLHKEGLVDVTRSPHLDNAHVLLYNVQKMDFVPEKSPTLFVNVWDLTTIRLRCDYDGDHFWYSQNADLLDLIQRTYNILGNLPIDWEAPESAKGTISKSTIAEFISGLQKGSEIGLYADALTKMWANGYDHDVCCWLTYAGNVLIDAAKHGNVKIDKPDAVKAIDDFSLPEFCRFAKADKEHPADSPYWTEERVTEKGTVLPPRTAYSGSFLDRYSRRVGELVPYTLIVKGLDDLIFDSTVMLIKPDRMIGKLVGLSKKSRDFNPETMMYDDGGLFQQIAFRQAAEWKELLKYDEFKMTYREWEDAKAAAARQEMIVWARARYEGNAAVASMSDDVILEGIYDIVTRNIFNTKMSEGMDTVVKNAFWRIFGEMAYNVICHNLGEEALNFDPRLDDDDMDEEEVK